MIHVTNIRNMKPETHDHTYVIVRSLNNPIKHAEQITALSPSTTIFWEFLRRQKAGQWNQTTFDTWYTPAFLQQIANDNNAKEILRDLIHMDRQGKDIVLACFCSNPSLCQLLPVFWQKTVQPFCPTDQSKTTVYSCKHTQERTAQKLFSLLFFSTNAA